MNIEQEKAYILIDKYHRGQASQEEILSLNAWKYASNQNEDVFEEMIYLLDLISGLKEWKQFDKQKAWNIFRKNVGLQKLSISWQKLAGIAAIFIFVLAATFSKYGFFSVSENARIVLGSEQMFSVFEDGSEFMLDSDAMINYSEFSQSNRLLNTEGDFFVHVSHNPQAPFEIETKNLKIHVLGTSFKVEEEGENAIVRVRDGRVRISTNDGTSYELAAGEKLSYSSDGVKVSKLDNYDWGLFEKAYNDQSVFTLLNDLAIKYPYFQFSADSISPECRITTKIEQATIIEILQELSLIFNVAYNIVDGQIVVSQISC